MTTTIPGTFQPTSVHARAAGSDLDAPSRPLTTTDTAATAVRTRQGEPDRGAREEGGRGEQGQEQEPVARRGRTEVTEPAIPGGRNSLHAHGRVKGRFALSPLTRPLASKPFHRSGADRKSGAAAAPHRGAARTAAVRAVPAHPPTPFGGGRDPTAETRTGPVAGSGRLDYARHARGHHPCDLTRPRTSSFSESVGAISQSTRDGGGGLRWPGGNLA